MRILHIALTDEWVAGQAARRYEVSSRGRTLADEGFIHTSTSRQVDGVLAGYYADLDPADLSLLVIDVDALERAGSPVRWDQVTGAPAPFPHIYGPIVPSAVVAVLPIGRTDGRGRPARPGRLGRHGLGRRRPAPACLSLISPVRATASASAISSRSRARPRWALLRTVTSLEPSIRAMSESGSPS